MKNYIAIIFFVVLFCTNSVLAKGEHDKYSIDVSINNIPKDQQTLFIPIMIDTMVLDFDKVSLEGLATSNILAVASSSKDKVGPGVGLIKLDESGLPEALTLKVLLKQIGRGETLVSLIKVADEPALPSKGTVLNEEVKVNFKSSNEVEISENTDGSKKKFKMSQNKITLEIQRPSQKEESIFIPIIFDKKVVDLDETFGHAILAPGISAKSFSSSSLYEGGPGVEILLTEVADKDFSVDVDLISRGVGTSKLVVAFPQKGHTEIVKGPIVNINPSSISVLNNPVVIAE
ncbi:MAG: hypothetical protein HYY52_01580 [Candidatus Melainabacteria bacterium]|nr:hypothetical protein [Candidatus Melainabacteria bacterium]